MGAFYVYQYRRPWGDREPCYIGKGKGDRWRYHERLGVRHPNKAFAAIFIEAQRHGAALIREKLREGLTEDEALDIERSLISQLGLAAEGGPLVNLTRGGQGISGLKHRAESKQKIGEYWKGRKRTPEESAKLSAWQTGRKLSDETKRKLSAAARARSPEARRNMSLAQLGKKHSAETKAKMSASRMGHSVSAETRAKFSAAQVGRKYVKDPKTGHFISPASAP